MNNKEIIAFIVILGIFVGVVHISGGQELQGLNIKFRHELPKDAQYRVYHKMNITGYYPSGYTSAKESKMEGGNKDKFGYKLKTLGMYKKGRSYYVSTAVDPKVIPLRSFFLIDKIPGVIFCACDVGGRIKGSHVDVCVDNKGESYRVTHSEAKITLLFRRF